MVFTPSSRTEDYFHDPDGVGLNAIKPFHPISRHINLDQAQQLRRYQHVSEPDKAVAVIGERSYYDKVQPLMGEIQKAFSAYDTLKTNVSIDEMIVRFTGRSKNTMRIKGKPTPKDIVS